MPIHLVSIIAICVMIGTLVLFYLKKWMITYGIIIANFIVFIISLIAGISFFNISIINDLAFKPIYLSLEYFPQLYTIFTSMFLHSTVDYFHILWNMIMFLLIAPSFERMRMKKFLAIYIVTGICAALFHSYIAPLIPTLGQFSPYIGLIGASGDIPRYLAPMLFHIPKTEYFSRYIS